MNTLDKLKNLYMQILKDDSLYTPHVILTDMINYTDNTIPNMMLIGIDTYTNSFCNKKTISYVYNSNKLLTTQEGDTSVISYSNELLQFIVDQDILDNLKDNFNFDYTTNSVGPFAIDKISTLPINMLLSFLPKHMNFIKSPDIDVINTLLKHYNYTINMKILTRLKEMMIL